MINLKNQKAIITGASKGIGKSIAFKLAEHGCDLFLLSRNQDSLDSVKSSILKDFDINIKTYPTDIGDYESVNKRIFLLSFREIYVVQKLQALYWRY